MSKRISALLLCLFLFCLLIVFPAAGCGQNSSSGSGEEPPVFSPLKVLVPEAPGTDIFTSDTGYFKYQSGISDCCQ